MYDRPRRPDEDAVSFGVRTGRIAASRAYDWRAMIADGTIDESFIEQSLPPHLPVEVGVGSVAASEAAPVQQGSKYAANPLLEQLPRRIAASAAQTVPPPKLFGDADLPPHTASGLDPALLKTVPWKARHAVAEANTIESARELVAACTGPDADATVDDLAEHRGVAAYRAAMTDWAVATGIVDDVDIDPRTGIASVRIWEV